MLHAFRRTTQFQYAVIYVSITAITLLCLNLLITGIMQQLMFQNKHSSVYSRAQLVASSFSATDALTEDSVSQVMQLLGDVESDRVIVTDEGGLCLYDSSLTFSAVGTTVLFPEIVSALSGNNVFYCSMNRDALQSNAALPIMSLNNPIGAVYLMEYDQPQAQMFATLSHNLIEISLLLELAVIIISVFFSMGFSKRIRKILSSISIVREGDYNHVLAMRGHDELTDLSEEFNKLTRRLQEGEQVRRQFVSDASHELKTPLASIKLLSDSILQNEMPPETVREFVSDIGSEADRLTRLSQKLLTLSKLDSEVEDALLVVDASEIARRVCRMLQPQAQLRHIEIRTKLQQGCFLKNYEDSMHQITFNLVENAIKYNRDGGSVTVTVSQASKKAILEVADTGVGIPEDEMQHVFDRFYRVDKARSRAMGGAGLGLSIVHDLVKRGGGEITVRANPEGGTIFRVVFPQSEQEVTAL